MSTVFPDSTILIIDDEEAHADATAEALQPFGCKILKATSSKQGMEIIESSHVDVLITDLRLPDGDGLDILLSAKQKHPDIEIIPVTGYPDVQTAVEAMQKGAATYLVKPVNLAELRTVVEKALQKQRLARRNIELERQLDERFGFQGIIGTGPRMVRIFEIVRQIAPTSVTVLISGESGTGKELLAKAIHNNSPRKNNNFVALSCAALSESILESELFGHEKGAFTGATMQRKGRFEYAHNGTLFLDEVGDMPLSTQVKLLRVIETREIMRLGSNVPLKVDVRLVAATNQDLEKLVKENVFREDLYFRLNVVNIKLPPLRERREDVPLLIDAFIRDFSFMHGKRIAGMTPEARAVLSRYDWPGNVRELKNCIESMVVVSRNDMLDIDDIPENIRSKELVPALPTVGTLAGLSLEEAEKELIRQTLALTGGNREETARRLRIGERTLYRKLDKYGLR
jgi:two-component system response regulator HydG